MYYVNNYMPHGQMIATGQEVCINDGRTCGEKYVEDTRNLDIPDWVRFLKEEAETLIFALIFIGISAGIASKKYNHREE